MAALDALHETLLEAGSELRLGDIAAKRKAIIAATEALLEYFEKQGFETDAKLPIAQVLGAALQANDGSTSPLFLAQPRPGRPRKTFEEKQRDGTLAALAELWLQADTESGDHAAKLRRAARAMKGPWFGRVTEAQLRRARKTALEEAPMHPTRHYYVNILDVAKRTNALNMFKLLVARCNEPGADSFYGKSAPQPES